MAHANDVARMQAKLEESMSDSCAPKETAQPGSGFDAALALALDHDTTGVTTFDAGGNLHYVNRAFSRTYGISHAGLSNHTPFQELLGRMTAAGMKVDEAEKCLRPPRGDASRRQVRCSVELPSGRKLRIQHLLSEDGGWVTRHIIAQDGRIRSAISDEILSLQTLIDQVPDYLWIKNLQSEFVVANRSLAWDSGMEHSSDLIGLSDADLHAPELARKFRQRELEILKTGIGMIDEEELVVDADGEEKVLSSSKMPLRDGDGKIIGLIGVARDISSRKKAEEHRLRAFEAEETSRQLTKALEYEREINAQQRQFVSMASHEFRTPLAIIDGAAQRLLRNRNGIKPEYVAEKAENIRRAVGRVVELMESILSFEKLASGKATINRADCPIRDVLAACCKRQAELSCDHEIALDLGTLPETIAADKSALEQVFTNLLSNAVKYSPGAPKIDVKGWMEGSVAKISVSDHGLGMDEDDIPKVFERFFRARTATGIAGTGIGLHLVKQIVELHGGEITLQSKPGEGSTFTVSLPLADLGAGI